MSLSLRDIGNEHTHICRVSQSTVKNVPEGRLMILV